MNKLLVNSPAGRQEIIEVSDGGGYFDVARVIWDERIDGPMPAVTLGAMVRSGDTLVIDSTLFAASTASSKAASVAQALLKIDAETDAIYGAILGNRAEEYTGASDDAAAYKLAGYTGIVPPGVSSWATAKGWTATAAANDILATTTAWVTAQNGIRATRLARKEQVRAATDAAGISTVLTAWAGFVVYMRGQLGL